MFTNIFTSLPTFLEEMFWVPEDLLRRCMGVQTATHKVCGRLRVVEVVVQKQKAHQWFVHSTVHISWHGDKHDSHRHRFRLWQQAGLFQALNWLLILIFTRLLGLEMRQFSLIYLDCIDSLYQVYASSCKVCYVTLYKHNKNHCSGRGVPSFHKGHVTMCCFVELIGVQRNPARNPTLLFGDRRISEISEESTPKNPGVS